LFTAARATHFLRSIRDGAPELDLTAESIALRMGESSTIGRALADHALAELRSGADGTPPSRAVVEPLSKRVGTALEELSIPGRSASLSGSRA
jgi:hypothetical protein